MKYDEFKKALINTLNEKGIVAEITTIVKNGYDIEALATKTGRVSPIFYPKSLYDDFCNGTDLGEIIDFITEKVQKGVPEVDELDILTYHPERLSIRLQGYAEEGGICQEICRGLYKVVVVEIDLPGGIGTAKVSGELAVKWGMSVHELMIAATLNADKHNDIEVVSIADMMNALMPGSVEEVEAPPLFVVRSDRVGAAAICLPNVAAEIGKNLGTYAILPSSRYEVLCHPIKESEGLCETVQMLSMMVREINSTEVDECDRLSDEVFLYVKGRFVNAMDYAKEAKPVA